MTFLSATTLNLINLGVILRLFSSMTVLEKRNENEASVVMIGRYAFPF